MQNRERLRDRALERLTTAHPSAIDQIVDAVRKIPRGNTLTTDDVWSYLDRRGVRIIADHRVMGAAMINAKKLGLIKRTRRWLASIRAACHSRPVAEWRRI